MRVDDEVLKCVVFVGAKKADGTMVLLGTAFYFGRSLAKTPADQQIENPVMTFLVTARHVIEGIRKLGLQEVYIRVNTNPAGSAWLPTNVEAWRIDDDVKDSDVAVFPAKLVPELDHLRTLDTMSCVPAIIEKYGLGLGDEVLIVGLFKHHGGNDRNAPIVRVGNVSAFNEHNVQTRIGPIHAHLVEARSIGGLSGSPVFLSLGQMRVIEGAMKVVEQGGASVKLLGLIHGHFDEKMPIVDPEKLEELTIERVNTGIAIVVPIEKILLAVDSFIRSLGPDYEPRPIGEIVS